MNNIEWVEVNKIKPYENNPRKNDTAVENVANSIKEFGWQQPIVVDKNYVIIVGHTRFKAGKKLGYDKVPIIVADKLNDEQVKAYRLADNKVAEVAEWDFNMLDAELGEILDIDMSDFGFDLDSLNMDELGTEFTLASGEKSDLEQITFTLASDQAELIRYAMEQVKDEVTETFGNDNKNGNRIYEVVRQWAELKK